VTFPRVLATEVLKLRRTGVTWLSLAALSLGPLAIALFMWIVREPERARQLGLLGTKAELSGISATWPSYFSMLSMVVGMGGLLLLAFIVAFVFAREYVEGTAKNLLALPVGRHWFVLAKLVVAGVWWAVLVATVTAETFLIGWAMALPGFSAARAAGAVRDVVVVAAVVYMLAPVVAWIATLARGYMAPLGFALAMLVLAQVFGKTGWGPWFPWSIVGSFVGSVGGLPVASIVPGSVVVVLLTFLAGIAATIAQLQCADNTQ
jgi:ABC-type transport system involved in multi-copper enzyme maturation permease subunit